jgi:uncharacterized protein (TIGR02588 family)
VSSRGGRGQRSAAEWTAFAAASVVLAIVVGLVAADLVGTREGVQLTVQVTGSSSAEAGGVHVPVRVANTGDEAAADVLVRAELTIDGTTTDGELLVDFLSGGASEDLVFVLPAHPDDGDLTVRVVGYRRP